MERNDGSETRMILPLQSIAYNKHPPLAISPFDDDNTVDDDDVILLTDVDDGRTVGARASICFPSILPITAIS